MIVNYLKAKPLDYDPYEEDCCGNHSADVLIVHEDREATCPDGKNVVITIKESKSGIGDSFRIIIEANGVKKEIYTAVEDDGEFVCQMQGNDL
jgi:hypothetical protein